MKKTEKSTDVPVKKRSDITIREKISLLEQYDKLPKMGQIQAAAQLKIHPSVLGRILKDREKIIDESKDKENLDRKRIRKKKDCADEEISLKYFATQTFFSEEWCSILYKFPRENIYRVVDSLFFHYSVLPKHIDRIKNKCIKKSKAAKQRIAFACCYNMDGKKEKLVVVGKSESPLCPSLIGKLPVNYYFDPLAQMKPAIFGHWLQTWDDALGVNRRIICLLMDITRAPDVENVKLNRIKIVLVPTLCREGGMTYSVKGHYRCEMLTRVMEKSKGKCPVPSETKFLDVLHHLTMSWNKIPETQVQKEFLREGILKTTADESTYAEYLIELPTCLTTEEFVAWMEVDDYIEGEVVKKMADGGIMHRVMEEIDICCSDE